MFQTQHLKKTATFVFMRFKLWTVRRQKFKESTVQYMDSTSSTSTNVNRMFNILIFIQSMPTLNFAKLRFTVRCVLLIPFLTQVLNFTISQVFFIKSREYKIQDHQFFVKISCCLKLSQKSEICCFSRFFAEIVQAFSFLDGYVTRF